MQPRNNGYLGTPLLQGIGPGRFSPKPEERSLILTYWRTLVRQRWLLIVVAALGAVAGLISTLGEPALYRARTSVEVQVMNDDFMNLRTVDPTNKASSSADSAIQTQTKLLQSESLMNRVIDRMRASGSRDRISKE